MIENVLQIVLYIALAVHIVLFGIAVWRVWRGEHALDRLAGSDLIGTLTLAILLIAALIQGRNTYIDVALGLAAVTTVGTIALSKYIADEEVF